MDSADSALKAFFVRITSPEVLAEVIAIVIASLIAVAGAQAVRAWQKRHVTADSAASGSGRMLEAAVQVAPFILALTALALVRATLHWLDMHTAVVDIALQLTIALIIVRLGVYVLRLSLDAHVDELQMKRLKKRKLMLKDQITRLESQLIPDLNA